METTKCEYQILQEKMSLDNETLYLYIYSELDYLVAELFKIVKRDYFNLSYNLLLTSKKMLDIWESIFLIYNNHKDNTSLCTLTRSTIDNYAFLHLLFVLTDNVFDREIRLYLHILDGVKVRKSALKNRENEFNDKYLTRSEYEETNQKCLNALYEDEKTENYIHRELNKISDIYLNRKIIEESNWRFKDPQKGDKKKNQYSWMELYKEFAKNNSMATMYMDFLSQFVHGLGISNMQYGENENMEFILMVGVVTMEKTKVIILKQLQYEISMHNIDFRNSDALPAFVSLCSEEYLREIRNGVVD